MPKKPQQADSSSSDRFGLGRLKLIVKSGIRDVFTPFTPVSDIDLLFGRSDEVSRLISVYTTPGQHALIFGERGVGKSSLANVVNKILLGGLFDNNYHSFSCTTSTTFEDLVEGPLRVAGIDISLETTEITSKQNLSGGVTAGLVNAGGGREDSQTTTYRRLRPVTPSEASSALAQQAGLLVIDEADALQRDEDKVRIAEFVKLLSDRDSKYRVMIVGIAETASELTGAHPSVQRCLREIRLRRIPDSGLEEIIDVGASQVDLTYRTEVIKEIVYCSDGYPYFTHLLALKSGELATSDERVIVEESDLRSAMDLAAEDSEGSLRNAYDDAVRSSSTDMYRTVLHAASLLPGPEFTSEALRQSIEKLTGEPITQGSLNNYFQKLVNQDGTLILRRVKKGMYRFADPRMAAYVRMVNSSERLR